MEISLGIMFLILFCLYASLGVGLLWRETLGEGMLADILCDGINVTQLRDAVGVIRSEQRGWESVCCMSCVDVRSLVSTLFLLFSRFRGR